MTNDEDCSVGGGSISGGWDIARGIPPPCTLVGRRHDHPRESFRVGRDVHAGYFLAIRPLDEESEQPVWIAKAITASHCDPKHPNSIQIQYWTLAATQFVDAITYEGWDSSSGNNWRKDSTIRSGSIQIA